jgi:hypothetical protein
MYGTIARIHPKGGDVTGLRALLEEWNRERRPEVPGARDGYLFVPDSAWYVQLRAQLEADPDWMDGVFNPA